MTTGKTIALTRRTFVDKVMSVLFNMLSRLAVATVTICSDFGAQENEVHSKDYSWVFIRRTDAKAETPILWPPHAKS